MKKIMTAVAIVAIGVSPALAKTGHPHKKVVSTRELYMQAPVTQDSFRSVLSFPLIGSVGNGIPY